VILFLHGAAERGSDGLLPTAVGLGPAVNRRTERWPALIVTPQCPLEQRWRDEPLEAALKALEEAMNEFNVDQDRVYVTGVSMGGFGSFLLAAADPGRFEAIVPVCGGGVPSTMAEPLKDMPIWAFHGAADDVVPVQRSREMVEAIRAAGNGRLRYTEYAGIGHESWLLAYEEEELPGWLFGQSR
jgi:predicted peptidase